MRLVDADALKEQFIEGAYTTKGIREVIDNAPSVDMNTEVSVAYLKGRRQGQSDERPQGEWILVDDTEKFIAKCSVCGRIEDSRMVKDYPFCHCGAKMNGDS